MSGRGGRGVRRRGPSPGGGWTAAAALLLCLLAAPASAAPSPRVDPEFATPGPGTPAGATVASAALIENASAWDGRVISFAGEAVGEAMARGGHAWLHVNDDAYQVRNLGEARRLVGYNSGQAIWAPLELARRVRLFGDYRTEGDTIRVSGEFHAACREHGGDMDIHATALEVVRGGRAVAQRLNLGRLGFGFGLLAFAGALWLMRFRGARAGRRGGAEGRSPSAERSEHNEEVPAVLLRHAIRLRAERDRELPKQDMTIDERANGRVDGGPQRQDPAARIRTR